MNCGKIWIRKENIDWKEKRKEKKIGVYFPCDVNEARQTGREKLSIIEQKKIR